MYVASKKAVTEKTTTTMTITASSKTSGKKSRIDEPMV
jgi:hypothetical protein